MLYIRGTGDFREAKDCSALETWSDPNLLPNKWSKSEMYVPIAAFAIPINARPVNDGGPTEMNIPGRVLG